MKEDSIEIEILQDGTIKVTTDQISPANHVSADNFLQEIERLAGTRSIGGYMLKGQEEDGDKRRSPRSIWPFSFQETAEVGKPQFFLAQQQGENQLYQPDIVRLRDCWGCKLGQIIIIFRE